MTEPLVQQLEASEFHFEAQEDSAEPRKRPFSFLMLTCWVCPAVCYFTGPEYYAAIGAIVFAVWQFSLGLLGQYQSPYKLRCHIHLFFATLFICLVLYEVVALSLVIGRNNANCSDFLYNRVCEKRWGVLTSQMVLLMLIPGADCLELFIYRFYLKVTEKLN